jgi:formate/nitrite transporter
MGSPVAPAGGDRPAAEPPPPSLDALVPAATARKAEEVGVAKASMAVDQMFVLGVLAGSFISLGALFATVVTAGGGTAPGVARLLGGLVFSLGLILVVVAGAELFTGNTLVVMAVAGRRLSVLRLLRSWVIVYAGNAAGAIATACLVVWSGRFDAGDGSIGQRAIDIGIAKTSLAVPDAFVSAVLANALVCLAVWLSMSARSVTDKILAVVPPISAFVAAGFEHSIANLYFVPAALFQRAWGSDATHVADDGALTWGRFLWRNLAPVTAGNIVGGAVLVGLVYWFVYLRPGRPGR